MPEQFGFACFLERSANGDPRPIIDATAILFCEYLGSAIELSVLDYKIGTQVRKAWCHEDQLLQTWPGPTQILFVYFGDPEKRRGCISLSGTTVAAELTVAMGDMTLASRTDDVADLCMGFYAGRLCRAHQGEKLCFWKRAKHRPGLSADFQNQISRQYELIISTADRAGVSSKSNAHARRRG
jgi:hypothetical protein